MDLKFLPWMVCILLTILAFILKFWIPGYSFSALVCCAITAIIAFYTLAHRLLPRFPAAVTAVRRIFTVCLCTGLALAAVTEGIILHYSFGTRDPNADYIIVLGAKVRDTGPSVSLMDRILAAEAYLKAHPEVTAVVSGGQGADEPMTEALAMRNALVQRGIAPERILMEEKATSTWENLTFSLDLLEEATGQRPQKIGVLSSEYHLFRASLFAKKCGVEFVGIPANTSRLSQKLNHFLREIAGVWHFIILGGRYD